MCALFRLDFKKKHKIVKIETIKNNHLRLIMIDYLSDE